ncbi:MAG: hypothetical protein DLM57_13325 [Pseudonocardiales bacterium]|nr:MAG: hypothetical protein DLM57_13325 [Pseudonocardiales bacterium]
MGRADDLTNVTSPTPTPSTSSPRQPLLVISPDAKRNAVDHTLTTPVSVTRLIEDNWLHGKLLGGGSFDAAAGL